jgi:hypothetical protein
MVTARKINVFFYGLFMDMGLLQQRGLAPSHPQVAWLDGYDIAICERATLLVNPAERAYGIVAGLTHAELATLYAEPSVQDYRPEAVLVTLEDMRQVPALCYNLPPATGIGRNTAYASRLLELATRLAFPGAYLDKLQKLAQVVS